MKRNRCLNFFKGIACFGIVLAHEKFPGTLGIIMWNLAHWVVLFFYIISGYYAYYPDKEIFFKKLPSKIIHILKITIFAILIYFCFLLVNHIFIDCDVTEWLKNVFSLKTIFDVIIMNDFEGTIKASHLWYLPSLIYCYLLLYLAVKHNKIKIFYVMIPIFIILRILVPYLPGYTWHYQQNVLLGAMPYFFIGYYYASHKQQIDKLTDKLSNKQIILIIIMGFLLRLFDLLVKPTVDIFEIGAIISAIAIFTFAQKNPDVYISKFIENIGIKYSLFIYVMHILVAMIIKKIFEILSLTNYYWYPYLFPTLLPIITLILAISWDKFYNRIKNIKVQKLSY